VTRQEAARGFLESLASEVPGSTRTRITIDSLFVREDTAVVYTRQHYARNQRAADSTAHELVTNVEHREHWVRTPEGWKVRYLEEVAEGPFTLDGQEIHVDSPGRRFTRTFWAGGVDSLRASYERFRVARPEELPFEEGTLNDLGYRLLGMGRIRDAIRVLELNVEAYPTSSNVYDSLAEAYMAHNDKELSIANYKKSLELDPNNANAKARLATLTGEQKDVKVDPKILDSYVGEYQLGPTFTITITSEDGKLMAQATGQDKFELFPTSETDFYLKVVPASVTFVKDAEGKVTELILTQSGRKGTAKKIR